MTATRSAKPKRSTFAQLAAAKLKQIKPQGDAPDIIWAPIPNSPQEKAYYSPADELFYGGAAGSGKGGSCYGIQWAIDNIPCFTVDCYPAIRHLVPADIQRRDTTVLGADGRFIPFSLLNEGDRIMNPDGHPQFIRRVFERGTLPIYRVDFEDGTAVECDRDHLWLVAKDGDWNYPVVRDVEWLKTRQDSGGIFFVPTCKPLQFDALPPAIDDPLEAAVSHARTQGLLAQIIDGTVTIWGSDRGKRITAITPAGQVYTRCIAVSNPNQLYITDGYTVTHNTDLLLGLAGTGHKRSLILRREFPRIRGMIERSRDIYNRFGAERDKDSYNESLHLWRLQDDRTIEFGAVQYERDWLKFQGRDHDLKCVGAGTLVWMADGSKRPIETVQVGDFVATLDGARMVTRCIQQVKPAVLLRAFVDGECVGSQVQGRSHELLLGSGEWASLDTASGAYHRGVSSPTSPLGDRKSSELSMPSSSLLSSILAAQCPGQVQPSEPFQYPLGHQFWWDLPAYMGQPTQGIGSLLSNGSPLKTEPPPLLSRGSLVPALPHLPIGGFACAAYSTSSAVCDGHLLSSLPNSTSRYWCELGLCGEQPHPFPSVVLVCPPQSADAGQQSPNDSQADAQGKTPTRTRHRWSYVHPYTKEIRQTDLEARASSSCDAYFLGLMPLFDLTIEGSNHYITGAGFVNRNCFDEITEFTEKQYRSINIWNRSSEPNQRVRSVCTGNPPTSIDGEWVIDYWAPWLDSDYPNPARPEDLVWFVRVKKDYVDVLRELNPDIELIPGKPDPVNDEVDLAIARTTKEEIAEYQATGEPIPRPTIQIGDKIVTGKSRTFIPGKVEDNPYLMAAGYDKQLDALPEELRIRFRQGIFVRVMEDSTNQIVPTAWVVAAQERWIALMGTNKLLPTKDAIALYKQLISNVTQTVIGCDPARGGIDKTCLAARYGNWYAPVLSIPGKDTPTGQDVARHIASLHEYPGRIAIDVIGIGSSPYDACKERRLPTVGLNGAEKAVTPTGKPATDRSGLLTFANKRAEWIWKFAEMLDPQHGSEIMLPPDPEIKTDLCSIRRVNTESRVIQVERKSEIKERIGRSPDKGESIIYASVVTRAVYVDITTSDPNPIRSVLSEL